MAKRSYTIRLEQEDVQKMLDMTGLTFTNSIDALIESYIKDSPFNILTVDKGVYRLTYKPVRLNKIDN